MSLRSILKWIFSVLVAVLLLSGGFAAGFVSNLQMKSAASSEVHKLYLRNAGDAPPEVRSGVITALKAFQDGYIKRDPKGIDSFMSHLFAKNEDVLVLGTDAGEWVRGYPAAAEFIRADWQYWGDFRFSADDSIICSSGNVAWVTSIGVVHFKGSDRPLRFSAILARNGSSWLFREMHFQWDDRNLSSADILRPNRFFNLVRLAFRRITNNAG